MSGNYLSLYGIPESVMYPISNMSELIELIGSSDKVIAL
jgi:hypothetical protein